ncbi:plasmid mobilization relaxosome protein MobC [Oscillospiraceae bacterium 42-9]
MKDNRKRAETLTIRLTKAEKEMIQKKAKKAQLSVTDFLVATSLRTEIHVAEDIKPLLIELKRIGNNINQITMKINAGVFHSAEFSEVIQGQRMLYEQLLRIAGGR